MTQKKKVQTYKELKQRVLDVISAQEGPFAIIGGHYPISQEGTAQFTPEDDYSFGCFSPFTAELATEAIQFAKGKGKDAKLAVIVDDHSMMDDKEWYLKQTPQAEEIRKIVEQYFSSFELPKEFQRIMKEKGIALEDILKSEQGLAFQESYYREKFAREYPGESIGCSGEYSMILQELAEKGTKSVIALIPAVCQGPTCKAMGMYLPSEDSKKMEIMHTYLSSSCYDTPEKMLEQTKKDFGGGIPIIKNR